MADERQPFASPDAAMACFAEHVSRGKVELFQSLGIDLVMGRREGVRFWDAYSERSWINCHCNGGVFNLGHRNSRVVDAVRRALDHLDVGNHHLVSGYRAELARRLAATTGGELPGVVYGAGAIRSCCREGSPADVRHHRGGGSGSGALRRGGGRPSAAPAPIAMSRSSL